ncbi:MAG: ECF transporter S component [Candidatus Odinarchaeia archaeon]
MKLVVNQFKTLEVSINNTTLRMVLTAIFTSLSVALRVFKHLIIGPVQVINLPAVICFITALEIGAIPGFTVGFLSFLISDLLLGFGIWTFVTASFMGLIGGILGLFKEKFKGKLLLFMVLFIFLFLNDVGTSVLLYIIIGFQPLDALVVGLIGLFLPAGGGYMFAVGPITEISTSILVVLSIPLIHNALNGR